MNLPEGKTEIMHELYEPTVATELILSALVQCFLNCIICHILMQFTGAFSLVKINLVITWIFIH